MLFPFTDPFHFFYFQVPVTVYYESLCPDSKAFIVDQLTPTVRGPLGNYIDLTLVPYGKSSVREIRKPFYKIIIAVIGEFNVK